MDEQVRLLPGLVGADTVIIGQVRRPRTGSSEPATLVATDDPPGFFDPGAREAFARFWHQQPVVVHHFRGFAPRAMKVSDFLGDQQWRRSDVYNYCYGKRLGLAWEMGVQIRCTPHEVTCAALQRASRDFNERDRALLDLIAPHMRAGYARANGTVRRERRLGLLEQGLDEAGMLCCWPTAAAASSRPGPAPARSCGIGSASAGDSVALPMEIEAWRTSERGAVGPPVLDLRRPGRRLRLRLIAGSDEDAILISAPPADSLG